MIQELLKKIEDSYYWDARVKALDCNYFGDEVKVVFEDDEKDITYHFAECYKVKIEHAVECPKDGASKELTLSQIPYFLQDVELKEIELCQKKYMEFVVINLQKSNFDNSYYINYGFYVKDIHNDLQYPKNNECDITGRFLNETNKGIYQLDTMNAEELVVSLEKNILNSTTVSPIT